MRVPENLTYEKGHQGSSPGGHNFVFLNVSINKKPFFFSEVVINNNDTPLQGTVYNYVTLRLTLKHSEGRSSIRAVKEVRGITSVLDSNRVNTSSYPTTRSFKLYYVILFEQYIEDLRSQMFINPIFCDDMNKLLF